MVPDMQKFENNIHKTEKLSVADESLGLLTKS
jgi:hypothetical protein